MTMWMKNYIKSVCSILNVVVENGHLSAGSKIRLMYVEDWIFRNNLKNDDILLWIFEKEVLNCLRASANTPWIKNSFMRDIYFYIRGPVQVLYLYM